MLNLSMRVARVGAAAALLMFLPIPQDHNAQYKAQFDQETDPVRKAKLMDKLGDSQFELIRKDVEAGDFEAGLQTLEMYRDECRSVHQALKAGTADPERKPAGFKQLQISLRQNLNRLNELFAGMTSDQQKPFSPVRRQLEELNGQLMHELFPRQPGSSASAEHKP
jgi:hypothetical protein